MKNIRELYRREQHPVRVLQIGEGNFLRAFVDYAIDAANEENGFDGNVAIVMPRARKNERFASQDNLYTVCLRGQKDGKPYKENRVIRCIDSVLGAYDDYDAFMKLAELDTLRFVVSNTTEAGIVYEDGDRFDDCPPKTFPAKLTKFLFARYRHFHGAADKGLVMLPVELIDHNGETLKRCVLQYAALWQLEDGFQSWLDEVCIFASTLVDRIVAGYPKDQPRRMKRSWAIRTACSIRASRSACGSSAIRVCGICCRFPRTSCRWNSRRTLKNSRNRRSAS